MINKEVIEWLNREGQATGGKEYTPEHDIR